MYINTRETFDRKKSVLNRKIQRLRKSLERLDQQYASTIEAEKVLSKIGVKPGDMVLHKKFKVCEVIAISYDNKGKIKLSVTSKETGWHSIVLRKAEVLNDTGYLLFEKLQEDKKNGTLP